METNMALTNSSEIFSMVHRTMQESLDELTHDLERFRALGEGGYSADDIASFVDKTSRFVVFMRHAGTFFRYVLPHPDVREKMLQIKLHLLSVLKAMSSASKGQDEIGLHDLLTEELRDNLTMWKIQVLPILRSPRALSSGSPRD